MRYPSVPADRLPVATCDPAVMILPLTRGMIALIDAEDAELVSQHRWSAAARHSKNCERWYATANLGRGKGIYLHRLIADAPKGVEVDHQDGDGLNCRRYNLRHATHQENAKHRITAWGTSRFVGVHRNSRNTRWIAQLRSDGRVRHLGSFTDETEAAKAYDAAARETHGEYANPNFTS